MHLYALSAARGNKMLTYAQIAEVHHPDHLNGQALRRIYGLAPPAERSGTTLSADPTSGLWTALEEALKRL